MSFTSLNGSWHASQDPQKQVSREFVLEIPGSIHLGLIENGIIEETTSNKNELAQKWIAQSNFRLFRQIPALPEKQHHILRIQGVDTASEIYVDGVKIGSTASEFLKYDFPLPTTICSNATLAVHLESPVAYCEKKYLEYYEKYGYKVESSCYTNGIANFNFLRKASCSFAWDWGPSVPTLGIGDIGILSYDHGYIEDVKCLVQPIADATWKVHVTAYLCWQSLKKPTLSLELVTVNVNREVLEVLKQHKGPWSQNFETEFQVDVAPWCVVGTNEQVEFNRLYKVLVTLHEENQVVGRALGFRKVELIRKRDTAPSALPIGESFYIQINGVPIFAKGSNYIPPSVFHTRKRENSRKLLMAARASGMNCLRLWGGGRYEDESFYLECDRLGILLWHDMMYACSLFPGSDPAFLELCRSEVQQQMRRLAGHPCIAIWAGNNENEELLAQITLERPTDRERLLIDYQKLYIDTIMHAYESEMTYPEDLSKKDEKRETIVPFWPSSPSNGVGQWGVPGEQRRGDVHYWGVWHGNKPFEAYETVLPRFCSEFGFQSAPSYYDLVKQLLPKDFDAILSGDIPEPSHVLNWTSPEMEFLQRSPARGNLGIVSQIMAHMRMPTTFANQVWASQLLQGLAMQNGIFCWRLLQPYCMGTLYWQLNDIWTGLSWSTINHSGAWKLSQYFVKRAFSACIVTFKFTRYSVPPALNPSTEDAPFHNEDLLELWLTSDPIMGLRPKNTVSACIEAWSLTSTSTAPIFSKILDSVELSINSCSIWNMKAIEFDKTEVLMRSILRDSSGHTIAESEFFFLPLKRLTLKEPNIELTVQVEDAEAQTADVPESKRIKVTLASDAVALYVSLEELSTTFGGEWSDNGVMLYPGEARDLVCVVSPSHSRVHLEASTIKQFLLKRLRHVSQSSSS